MGLYGVKFYGINIPLRQKWKWIWMKSKHFLTHALISDKNFMRLYEMSSVTRWSRVVLNAFVSWIFMGLPFVSEFRVPEDRHQPNAEGLGSGTFVWFESMNLWYCWLVFFRPRKINMEPENTPLEEEGIIFQTINVSGSMLVFGGCIGRKDRKGWFLVLFVSFPGSRHHCLLLVPLRTPFAVLQECIPPLLWKYPPVNLTWLARKSPIIR